jgi:hypothetical protein
MLPQPIADALIVFGMFIVRIGLPVFILFGLAAWLQRKLQPRETEETRQRADRTRIIPFGRSAAQPKSHAAEQSELDEGQDDKVAHA